MKSFFLTLVVVTICVFANAQDYFIKNYDNSTTRTHSLIATTDSCYVMAGVDHSDDLFIFKTDRFGDTLWLSTYGGTQTEDAVDLTESSSGGYLVAGTTSSLGAGGDDVFLTHFDQQGNVTWSKTYGSSNDDQALSVISTSDGGFLVSGKGSSNNAGAWLLKIDASGIIQWEYSYANIDLSIGDNIIQTNDGGYAMIGKSGANLKMLRLDASGLYLWARQVSGSWQPGVQGFGILEMSNGNLLLYGDEQGARLNIFSMMISSTGNYLWGKTFRQSPSSFDRVQSALETADGGVVLSTVFETSLGLMKLSATGVKEWSYYYNGPETSSQNYDYKGRLAYNWVGGYALNSDTECSIVSTDSLGRVPCYGYQIENLSSTTNANLSSSNSAPSVTTSASSDITNWASDGHTLTLFEVNNFPSVTPTTVADDCTGSGSITLSVSGGNSPYQAVWTSSCTGLMCSNLNSGTEQVTVIDNSGCSVTESITVPHTATPHDLCITTVDSTSQFVTVRWEVPALNHITDFNIYRMVNGTPTLQGTVPFGDPGVYNDMSATVIPNQSPYEYVITALDTCGYESDYSQTHSTMWCYVQAITSNSTTIEWTDYQAASVDYFRIYRDTLANGDWELIDSVTVQNYTDNYYSSSCLYRVEAVFTTPCMVGIETYTTSLSNSASVQNVGINKEPSFSFTLSPNPVNSKLNITSPSFTQSAELWIVDLHGRVLKSQLIDSETVTIDVHELPSGFYYVRVRQNELMGVQKFIKQ